MSEYEKLHFFVFSLQFVEGHGVVVGFPTECAQSGDEFEIDRSMIDFPDRGAPDRVVFAMQDAHGDMPAEDGHFGFVSVALCDPGYVAGEARCMDAASHERRGVVEQQIRKFPYADLVGWRCDFCCRCGAIHVFVKSEIRFDPGDCGRRLIIKNFYKGRKNR